MTVPPEILKAWRRSRVLEGMERTARAGRLPCQVPLGYMVAWSEEGERRVEIDPVTGPLVREAFVLYRSGQFSLRALLLHLHQRGLMGRQGRPLSVARLYAALRNPFYSGHAEWSGIKVPSQHPVLIDDDCFAEVARLLKRGS